MNPTRTFATVTLVAITAFAWQTAQAQPEAQGLRVSARTAEYAGMRSSGSIPVIYPAKGQTQAQTDRDKLACYDWSRSQSGFDPMQQLQQPATQQQQPQSQAQPQAHPQTSGIDGNMAKGAAGGAAVAELTHGDASKGAAVGVLGAALRDRVKQQKVAEQRQAQAQQQMQAQQQAQKQAQSQQQAAIAQDQARFERGFAACLEARGYAVK